MSWGYDTYGSSLPTNQSGMESLLGKLGQAKKNNMGAGMIGNVANVGMGIATGNPIQAAMGMIGGVNDILAESKKRKAERIAKLQSIGQRY